MRNIKAVQLITRAGGATEVAKKLGVHPSNVHNWARRGIPKNTLVRVMELVRMKGVKFSDIRPNIKRGAK